MRSDSGKNRFFSYGDCMLLLPEGITKQILSETNGNFSSNACLSRGKMGGCCCHAILQLIGIIRCGKGDTRKLGEAEHAD